MYWGNLEQLVLPARSIYKILGKVPFTVHFYKKIQKVVHFYKRIQK